MQAHALISDKRGVVFQAKALVIKKRKSRDITLWAWWHMPLISAFGGQRQGDQEFKGTPVTYGFEARVDYMRPWLKKARDRGGR